jgi:hypothetical protein
VPTAAIVAWVLVAVTGWMQSAAVEAARAREARFRYGAVEFTLTETVTHQVRPTEPPRQTTFTKGYRLTLDENRVRAESWYVGPPPPKYNFVMPPAVAVSDGQLTRVFYPDGMSMDGQPSGLIDPSPQQQATGHGFIPRVVLQFVRPLDPAMTANPLDRFFPIGSSKPVYGVTSLEYLSPGPDGEARWLAPGQDFVVTHYARLSHERLSEETHLTHRRDAALGWVPETWTTSRYSDTRSVTRTAKGTITKWRLGVGFADGPLDLAFPAGTVVFDQRVNKHYRVKADGSWRELDVMGNEVPEPVERPWYRRYAWVLAGVVVVGALILSRVLKQRAATEPDPRPTAG